MRETATMMGWGNASVRPESSHPPPLPSSHARPRRPTYQDEEYIWQRYRASSFNVCSRHKIPTLSGSPPLKLNVKEEVTLVACHKLAPVPLHWQQAVREGLERDIRLGVIERVPLNMPVRWQSCMICAPKHDGSPRRMVDYNIVNTHCPRQTHHTPSPWQLASSIPGDTYKTVLDNLNRYHSVGLETEHDRDVTTFITTLGRFWYLVAPMGLRCSGDPFTDRMDRLYSDTERIRRCVDDTLLYDYTIEEQFYRTCSVLDLGSNHSTIFNPKKFQFCKK